VWELNAVVVVMFTGIQAGEDWGCSLHPPIRSNKFFGQSLNFLGSSQQPKIKNEH